MTDYNKATGSSGTMRIRDTGSVVEFWLNSNNSTTSSNNLPWGYTDASGTSGTLTFDYNAGAGWQKLRSWTVSTDQNVTFRIGDTGTSGFGGPTSFTVAIERSTIPSPPSIITFTSLTATTVVAGFSDGSNNGAAIDNRQIGFGTSSTSVQHLVTSDRSTLITGMAPGTLYYFWARTHNANGWSAWGPRSSITTIDVPPAPTAVVISNITQTSFLGSFLSNGNGGSTNLEYRIYYNTQPNDTDIQSAVYTGGTPLTITGLLPGTTYYVWSRARNVVGWGAYSEMRTMRTIAGAYVTVGAVQKEAIPYVRDGGVWKLARPWSRIAGVWKETT
jgi:hypothetical protein